MDCGWHVSEKLMRLWLDRSVSAREHWQVQEHVFSGCPRCCGLFDRLVGERGPRVPPPTDEEFDAMLDRVFATVIANRGRWAEDARGLVARVARRRGLRAVAEPGKARRPGDGSA
jgi:hypothetical protein